MFPRKSQHWKNNQKKPIDIVLRKVFEEQGSILSERTVSELYISSMEKSKSKISLKDTFSVEISKESRKAGRLRLELNLCRFFFLNIPQEFCGILWTRHSQQKTL